MFSGIFPERLEIFSPNFAHLLYVPIYARLQILFLRATTQLAFQPMVDILNM